MWCGYYENKGSHWRPSLCSFSRETPTRFKKELIKAAHPNDGTVTVDALNQILINIGKSDDILSEEELSDLLGNGSTCREISTTELMRLM